MSSRSYSFVLLSSGILLLLAACQSESNLTDEGEVRSSEGTSSPAADTVAVPWLNAGENEDLSACAAGDDGACEATDYPAIVDQRVVNFAHTRCIQEQSVYCNLSEQFEAMGKRPDRLSVTGFGRVEIGASLADAGLNPGVEECRYSRPDEADDLYVMVHQGTVARIDILDSERTLDNGLGIGSEQADVIDAYRDAITVVPNKYDEAVSDIEVRGPDGAGLVFEVENGKVRKYRLGRGPEVFWIEGCL